MNNDVNPPVSYRRRRHSNVRTNNQSNKSACRTEREKKKKMKTMTDLEAAQINGGWFSSGKSVPTSVKGTRCDLCGRVYTSYLPWICHFVDIHAYDLVKAIGKYKKKWEDAMNGN